MASRLGCSRNLPSNFQSHVWEKQSSMKPGKSRGRCEACRIVANEETHSEPWTGDKSRRRPGEWFSGQCSGIQSPEQIHLVLAEC